MNTRRIWSREIRIGLLVIIFMGLTDTLSEAQRIMCPGELRKYKTSGLWAVELGIGPKQWDGWVASVGVDYFFIMHSKKSDKRYHFPRQFIRSNFYYANDSYLGVYHRVLGFDVSLAITPFNVNDFLYGTFYIGGTYSEDQLTSKSAIIDETKSLDLLKPGGLIGFEVSSFFGRTSNVAMIMSFSQRSLTEKNWGNWRWYASVGIRYHIMRMRPLSHHNRR